MSDETQDESDLREVERLLTDSRPVPGASFRGGLRRRLLDGRPTAPRRLRLLIAAYAGSGALLLAVAAVGLAGAGPLAA